jgi:hypothetical protein
MHVLTWVLREHGIRTVHPEWADLRGLKHPPRLLPQRIAKVLELYQSSELLFVHRDAEGEPPAVRRGEILDAVTQAAGALGTQPPAVCVVPVRMQEAWFLMDEAAIRTAADNPRGRQPLDLPARHQIEQLPNPKHVLHELLKEASGYRGRRRSSFRATARVHRVAELTVTFEPLRSLTAFVRLEQDVQRVIAEMGLTTP